MLRGQVREHDLVTRLGGDEFAVVATRLVPSQAGPLLHRLRQALDGEGIAASFGAPPYSIADGFQAACAHADSEMYADKIKRKGTPPR